MTQNPPVSLKKRCQAKRFWREGKTMLGLTLIQKNTLTNYSESQRIRLGRSTVTFGRLNLAHSEHSNNSFIQLLSFSQVSRCHATIVHRSAGENDSWLLFDGKPGGPPSKAGLTVNGVRLGLRPHRLKDGDNVVLYENNYIQDGLCFEQYIGFQAADITYDEEHLFQVIDPLTTCDPDEVKMPRITKGEQEARSKVLELEGQVNYLIAGLRRNEASDKIWREEVDRFTALVLESKARIRRLTIALTVVTTFTACCALTYWVYTAHGPTQDSTERMSRSLESILSITAALVTTIVGGGAIATGGELVNRSQRRSGDRRSYYDYGDIDSVNPGQETRLMSEAKEGVENDAK